MSVIGTGFPRGVAVLSSSRSQISSSSGVIVSPCQTTTYSLSWEPQATSGSEASMLVLGLGSWLEIWKSRPISAPAAETRWP